MMMGALMRIRRFAAGDAAFSAGSGVTTPPSGADGGGGPLGGIFFSSLCVLTFGLGSWQTMRYFEKVDMVLKRENDLGMDPLPTYDDWRATRRDAEDAATTKTTRTTTRTGEGIAPPKKSYRRVRLHGEFRHRDEVLVGPRGPPPGALALSGPNSGRGGGGGGMSSSVQGYLVVTPFVIVEEKSSTSVAREEEEEDAGPKRRRGWFFGRRRGEAAGVSAPPTPPTDVSHGEPTVVWVNRGWIPRDFINKYDETVTSWHRPRGTVRLLAMESNTETPGMFAPPSRLEVVRKKANNDDDGPKKKQECTSCPRPMPPSKRLLWMDRRAMEELTSCGDAAGGCQHPPLFVEIKTDDQSDDAPASTFFPARASREYVGEFKVTPSVHAGYAFTWFGLSSAGIIMTRKLLSRGK
jgi:surfeit locus 1 family protein